MKKLKDLDKHTKIKLLILLFIIFLSMLFLVLVAPKLAKYDKKITFNTGCVEYYKNGKLINGSQYCLKERMIINATLEQQIKKQEELEKFFLDKLNNTIK
jgi:hypothetical protein